MTEAIELVPMFDAIATEQHPAIEPWVKACEAELNRREGLADAPKPQTVFPIRFFVMHSNSHPV